MQTPFRAKEFKSSYGPLYVPDYRLPTIDIAIASDDAA